MSAVAILKETLRPSVHGLKQATIRSAGWSSLSIGAKALLTLMSVPILARLISPEHYGVVGLATLVVEMVALFGEVGFHSALIQRKRVFRLDLDTAFWTNVLVGLVLALAVLAAAPIAVWFFKEPRLANILLVSAAALIVSNAAALHHTILIRSMRFRDIAVVEMIAIVSRIGSAIALAWQGYGYWALVFSALISFGVAGVLRFYLVPWLPRMRFEKARFLSLWRFGRNILADNMVAYFANNVDYVIVGRLLGPRMLGFYQMAFTLPDMLRKNLTQVLSRVLFPVFSRLQDDNERLLSGVRTVNQLVAVVALPLLGGLLVIAPTLVPFYFGANWLMVTAPLQWLCIAGIVRTLGLAFGPVFHAKGRPDVTVKLSLVRVPLVAGAVWLGSHWGILGAATGFACISVLWFFVNAHIVARLLHYPPGVFFAGLRAPCGATSVMAASVYWLLHVPAVVHLQLGWQIMAAVVVGASLYGGAMMLVGRQQLMDIVHLLAQFKK